MFCAIFWLYALYLSLYFYFINQHCCCYKVKAINLYYKGSRLCISPGLFLVPSSYHSLFFFLVCFMIIYCDIWRQKTNKQTNKKTNNQPNKQTNKQTTKQTNKQPNKQTNKQTNKRIWNIVILNLHQDKDTDIC